MSRSEGLISVIVPVYKVEKYLDRCVQSIVDQTYSNLEIILVDDGSPDNCPAMCDIWAEKDDRIQVIHKENGGLSDARNAGMAVVTGTYISFIDSDDYIAPEMLERLVKAMEDDHSDIAACAVEMVRENGDPWKLLTVKTNCVLNQIEAQKALLDESLLKEPVWYKLYKNDLIQEIPFERGKYHEDVFWSYQAIGKAQCISLIDYVGYYYTQRDGSIMGQDFSLKRLDAVEAYEKRLRYFAEKYPTLEKEMRKKLFSACIYYGQRVLECTNEEGKKQGFSYLEIIAKKYPLPRSAYATDKITHRLWFAMGGVSLRGVCDLKNFLKIGI